MKSFKTNRGFVRVLHPQYTDSTVQQRLIQESSAIGDYEDSDIPGSSFLWVGEHLHLNREEVAELIQRMQHWLDTKRLADDEADSAVPPVDSFFDVPTLNPADFWFGPNRETE
jgi:hypothetical protein